MLSRPVLLMEQFLLRRGEAFQQTGLLPAEYFLPLLGVVRDGPRPPLKCRLGGVPRENLLPLQPDSRTQRSLAWLIPSGTAIDPAYAGNDPHGGQS